jgi:hypothetical protein
MCIVSDFTTEIEVYIKLGITFKVSLMFHTLYDLGTNCCVSAIKAPILPLLFLSAVGLYGLCVYRRCCHEFVMTPNEIQNSCFFI